MNATTYKAVKAVLASDDTIPTDRKATALAILNGRQPEKGPQPLLLTQKQAAILLSVSRFTIRNMTRKGQLHPVQVHECWRYRRDELVDLATGRRYGSCIHQP